MLILSLLLTGASPCLAHADETEANSSENPPTQHWLERAEQWLGESRTFGRDALHAEYQFDTRDFNTIHLMGSARLPAGFDLWGFVDFEALPDTPGSRGDSSRFFVELDLRRKVWSDFGVVAELNEFSGPDNSLGRFGLFYMPSFDWMQEHALFVLVKGLPLETDDKGGQLSLAINKGFPTILGGRVSAGGFIDINFDAGLQEDDTLLVTEWQLRVRLIGNLKAMAEYRRNEFTGGDQEQGVGIGVRYDF